MLKFYLYLCILFSLVSCGSFLPDRAFIAEMNNPQDSIFKAGVDFPVLAGDTGKVAMNRDEIKSRAPADTRFSKRERELNSLSEELVEKENQLMSNPSLYSEYLKNKRYLKTMSEKLYYLSLGPEGKDYYINTKKDDQKDAALKEKEFMGRHSIHYVELKKGMTKEQLTGIMGRPNRVEFAGKRQNQNEKWIYFEDGSTHLIYLEGGVVDGWSLDI